jgi:uncharacterized delta-60 repeat protein
MKFNYSFFTFLCYLCLSTSFIYAQNNATYDASFVNNGYQEFSVIPASTSTAFGMDRQSDGKLLTISVVYPSFSISNGFGINRFNENGSLDSTFADNGLFLFLRDSFDCEIKDVHVLPNGKILFGATFTNYYDDDKNYFALFRLNANGSPDDSFGAEGIRNYDNSYFEFPDIFSTALLPDGTLLSSMISYNNQDLFVVKFLPNGDLDVSFGADGVATPSPDNLPDESLLETWPILLPSGGFIVASSGFDSAYYLTKFFQNGAIDPAYGSNGTSTFNVDPGFYPENLGRPLLQSSGKVVLSVLALDVDDVFSSYIFRANEDGSFDTSFGFNGYIKESFGELGAFSTCLYEMPDGSILGVGAVLPNPNSDGIIAFFKYSSDGQVDESFGQNGYVAFPEQDAVPYEAVIAPNNKVTICGDGYTDNGSMIARFNLEGISNTAEANLLNTSLQLSPNPATDHLNIQWIEDAPIEAIEILNAQGQLVQEYSSVNQNTIVLPQMTTGHYWLKIRDTKGRTAVQGFVKMGE